MNTNSNREKIKRTRTITGIRNKKKTLRTHRTGR